MPDSPHHAVLTRARWIYWSLEILLGLGLLLAVLSVVLQTNLDRAVTQYILNETSDAVANTYLEVEQRLEKDLAAFLPPGNPVARPYWARSIQQHLDRSAAVFLLDRDSLSWLAVPERLKPLTTVASEYIERDTLMRGRVDTLGAMELRRMPVEADSLRAYLVMTGPVNDNLRWGAVYRMSEGWRHFATDLATADIPGRPMPSAVLLLTDELQLHAPEDTTDGPHTTRVGLRASIGGEILYTTPALDTTNYHIAKEINDVRLEYFLSDRDQSRVEALTSDRFPWFLAALFFAVMAGIHALYRIVRRLADSAHSTLPIK